MTNGGHEIYLNDSSGALSITSTGDLSITAKGNLSIEAAGIKMNTSGEVAMKGSMIRLN